MPRTGPTSIEFILGAHLRSTELDILLEPREESMKEGQVGVVYLLPQHDMSLRISDAMGGTQTLGSAIEVDHEHRLRHTLFHTNEPPSADIEYCQPSGPSLLQ